MISEKAIEYAGRLDTLAEQEFGEAYTIKATYWNDGDFRLVAYCAKAIDAADLPGEAQRVYVELAYQDHHTPDDHAVRQMSAQDSDGYRSEPELYTVGESELVELPE